MMQQQTQQKEILQVQVQKDWWTRIDEAEKRGEFTRLDDTLACQWTTCACGEQDEGIPRNEYGAPIDDKLFSLGIDFLVAVSNDGFNRARDTLTKIQARAIEVLQCQA